MKIHKESRGFSTVEVLLIVLVLVLIGGAGWYVYAKNQNPKTESSSNISIEDSTDASADTKQQKDTDSQATVRMDYNKVFNEVSQQFGLTKEKLRLFWIYSNDKVVYAEEGQGPGVVYSYKGPDKWLIASEAIHYQAVCSEVDKLPEDYRPPCNATEGLAVAKKGDLTFKYVTDPSVWTAAEQLEKSSNYPASTRHKFLGLENN